MKSSEYIERQSSTLLNLGEAARQAEMSTQRFRRALQRLKIPVERSGWMVLVRRSAIPKVQEAFKNGLIRRGRPTKKRRLS
jgi:hypothetical protein